MNTLFSLKPESKIEKKNQKSLFRLKILFFKYFIQFPATFIWKTFFSLNLFRQCGTKWWIIHFYSLLLPLFTNFLSTTDFALFYIQVTVLSSPAKIHPWDLKDKFFFDKTTKAAINDESLRMQSIYFLNLMEITNFTIRRKF